MVAAEVPALDPRQQTRVKRSREHTNRPAATPAPVRPALDAGPAGLTAATPTMKRREEGKTSHHRSPVPQRPRPETPLPSSLTPSPPATDQNLHTPQRTT